VVCVYIMRITMVGQMRKSLFISGCDQNQCLRWTIFKSQF
jgi:hypothetical protein